MRPHLPHQGRPPAREGGAPSRRTAQSAWLARRARSAEEYERFRDSAVAHVIMGLGGETPSEDTAARIAQAHGEIDDEEIVGAIVAVMRRDAFGHRDLQAVDGRTRTGCR